MTRLSLLFLTLTLFSCNNNDNSKLATPITIPAENIIATKDQQYRRSQSENYCKTHNVPVYKYQNSLFVDPEEKVKIRTLDEVVNRALALCYIGLKSEGLEQKHLDKMEKDFNISSKLTAIEKDYATAKVPTEQQKIDANWRYESLHVMLWALGFIDSLSYPDQLCNVADDVKIIHELTEQQFRQKAKLRTKKEILDQADLILRLDWACVNARVEDQPAPGNLDKGVVFERHHSLNWLINYLNQEWDNVRTDT
jgi:cysteinyl-tRNA synthetase